MPDISFANTEQVLESIANSLHRMAYPMLRVSGGRSDVHEQCSTCHWYVADATEAVDEVSVSATGELMSQKSSGIGQCHCAAPIFGDWPTVFADDFCGDWECRGNE